MKIFNFKGLNRDNFWSACRERDLLKTFIQSRILWWIVTVSWYEDSSGNEVVLGFSVCEFKESWLRPIFLVEVDVASRAWRWLIFILNDFVKHFANGTICRQWERLRWIHCNTSLRCRSWPLRRFSLVSLLPKFSFLWFWRHYAGRSSWVRANREFLLFPVAFVRSMATSAKSFAYRSDFATDAIFC